MSSHGYEHRDPGLHSLSFCTPENLALRDGSGSTLSVPYMVLSTQGNYSLLKVAVNTIVPRSPFFLFLYLKTQTVTHIRKNAVEYLRQWNGAICVIYNMCQRQKIR